MDGHPPPRLRNSPGTQGYYHSPFTTLFLHILSHLVCLSVNGWSPSPQGSEIHQVPKVTIIHLSLCCSFIYCIQGPRFIFALFALSHEGEFKTGLILSFLKDYVRKLVSGRIQDLVNQSRIFIGRKLGKFKAVYSTYLSCQSVKGWSLLPAQKFTRYPRLLTSTFHYAVRSYT